jgi:hypothetical protein
MRRNLIGWLAEGDGTTLMVAGAIALTVIFMLLFLRRRALRRRRARRYAAQASAPAPVDAIFIADDVDAIPEEHDVAQGDAEQALDFTAVLFDVEALADPRWMAPAPAAVDDEPPEIIVELAANIAALTAAVDRLTDRLDVSEEHAPPAMTIRSEVFDWPSEDDLSTFVAPPMS